MPLPGLHPLSGADGGALWNDYYLFHRYRRSAVYTDACIYTPDICILKTDTDAPELLRPAERVTVDVLTCAAPNLREVPSNRMNPAAGERASLSKTDLREIHVKRARHLLSVAAANGVEVLVLGAFGCGAFRNDPAVVADAYREVLEEMGRYFRQVVFAVYCSSWDRRNFEVFDAAFGT